MDRRQRSERIHLIASLGGHLELLHSLSSSLADAELVWITSDGSRADELRRSGAVVRSLPRLDRGSFRVRSVLSGILLALRERPRVVVSSGAGLTVPFALVARLLGARLIFIETMARVKNGSASGRMLARCGAQVIVQWDELRSVYPQALVCRPTLLAGLGASASTGGQGTFVTVGSHDAPFDRLLEVVDVAAGAGFLPTPILVQVGVSVRESKHGEVVPYLTPGDFSTAVRAARIVVTHGGAGAIATALRAGKIPLVMPRSPRLGEHVDDHQDELVEKLDSLGLIVRIRGALKEDAVRRATSGNIKHIASLTDGLPTVEEALMQVLRRT